MNGQSSSYLVRNKIHLSMDSWSSDRKGCENNSGIGPNHPHGSRVHWYCPPRSGQRLFQQFGHLLLNRYYSGLESALPRSELPRGSCTRPSPPADCYLKRPTVHRCGRGRADVIPESHSPKFLHVLALGWRSSASRLDNIQRWQIIPSQLGDSSLR